MPSPRRSESGALLLIVLNVVVLLTAFAAALLLTGFSEYRETRSAESESRAFYIAEAGLSDALDRLSHGRSGTIGSRLSPLPFSNGAYWVESVETEKGRFTIRAHGRHRGEAVSLEAVAASAATPAYFGGAGFGDVGVELLGGAQTDSYDSSQGSYLSQATNHAGPRNYANPNGDIDSNGPVSIGLLSAAFGDVRPGIGNFVSILIGSLVTGTTAPRSAVKPLPGVIVPAALTALPMDSITVNNTTRTLPPGTYNFHQVDIKGSGILTIVGPATLLVDKVDVVRQGALLADAAAGPVILYVTGRFHLQDDAVVASRTRRPEDLLVFVGTDNYTGHEWKPDGHAGDPIMLEDDADFVGVIHAPRAVLSLKDDSEVFGSANARKLRMINRSKVHFDEHLLTFPRMPVGTGLASAWSQATDDWAPSGLEIVFWRRIGEDAPLPPAMTPQPPAKN